MSKRKALHKCKIKTKFILYLFFLLIAVWGISLCLVYIFVDLSNYPQIAGIILGLGTGLISSSLLSFFIELITQKNRKANIENFYNSIYNNLYFIMQNYFNQFLSQAIKSLNFKYKYDNNKDIISNIKYNFNNLAGCMNSISINEKYKKDFQDLLSQKLKTMGQYINTTISNLDANMAALVFNGEPLENVKNILYSLLGKVDDLIHNTIECTTFIYQIQFLYIEYIENFGSHFKLLNEEEMEKFSKFKF